MPPSNTNSVAQTPPQASGVPCAPPPPPPPPPLPPLNTSTPVKKEPSLDEVLRKVMMSLFIEKNYFVCN